MKGGVIDFVEKPYEAEALRRTLRAVEEERKVRAILGTVVGDEANIMKQILNLRAPIVTT